MPLYTQCHGLGDPEAIVEVGRAIGCEQFEEGSSDRAYCERGFDILGADGTEEFLGGIVGVGATAACAAAGQAWAAPFCGMVGGYLGAKAGRWINQFNCPAPPNRVVPGGGQGSIAGLQPGEYLVSVTDRDPLRPLSNARVTRNARHYSPLLYCTKVNGQVTYKEITGDPNRILGQLQMKLAAASGTLGRTNVPRGQEPPSYALIAFRTWGGDTYVPDPAFNSQRVKRYVAPPSRYMPLPSPDDTRFQQYHPELSANAPPSGAIQSQDPTGAWHVAFPHGRALAEVKISDGPYAMIERVPWATYMSRVPRAEPLTTYPDTARQSVNPETGRFVVAVPTATLQGNALPTYTVVEERSARHPGVTLIEWEKLVTLITPGIATPWYRRPVTWAILGGAAAVGAGALIWRTTR